jgi:hypothetical protein
MPFMIYDFLRNFYSFTTCLMINDLASLHFEAHVYAQFFILSGLLSVGTIASISGRHELLLKIEIYRLRPASTCAKDSPQT